MLRKLWNKLKHQVKEGNERGAREAVEEGHFSEKHAEVGREAGHGQVSRSERGIFSVFGLQRLYRKR